jgi:hypothetical protein
MLARGTVTETALRRHFTGDQTHHGAYLQYWGILWNHFFQYFVFVTKVYDFYPVSSFNLTTLCYLYRGVGFFALKNGSKYFILIFFAPNVLLNLWRYKINDADCLFDRPWWPCMNVYSKIWCSVTNFYHTEQIIRSYRKSSNRLWSDKFSCDENGYNSQSVMRFNYCSVKQKFLLYRMCKLCRTDW